MLVKVRPPQNWMLRGQACSYPAVTHISSPAPRSSAQCKTKAPLVFSACPFSHRPGGTYVSRPKRSSLQYKLQPSSGDSFACLLLSKRSCTSFTRITISRSYYSKRSGGSAPSLGILPSRRLDLRCFMQDTAQSQLERDMGSELQYLNVPEPVQPAEYIAAVGGYKTEFLELKAEKPALHVIVLPGNPGICSYYRTFVGSLFERLHGQASVTAISYVGFTEKSWEGWRTFSLQEQIDHKVAYVEQVCSSSNIPIVLVGHSIGSYIALDVLRRFPDRVVQVVGLYPFLTVNHESPNQRFLNKITHLRPVCVLLSLVLATLGALPFRLGPAILGYLLKSKWEPSVIKITSQYLLQYHVARNITHLGKTEFDTLWQLPDWEFLRKNQRKIALIFGSNDHWGPISLLKEVNVQAPLLKTVVEREGHLHAFCCTSAGSEWVACEAAKMLQETCLAPTKEK